MYIPFEALSAEAQKGLIEAYVLREGTDYGQVEYSFEEKCVMVRSQLASGKALIEFDLDSETALIVSADAAIEKKSVHRFKDGDPL
jgi:uncharacterized protein YheU (UPF0270 family)